MLYKPGVRVLSSENCNVCPNLKAKVRYYTAQMQCYNTAFKAVHLKRYVVIQNQKL